MSLPTSWSTSTLTCCSGCGPMCKQRVTWTQEQRSPYSRSNVSPARAASGSASKAAMGAHWTSAAVDADGLKAWMNERVGKTQRLTDLRLMDHLPRSAIGKVLKRELRDEYGTAR